MNKVAVGRRAEESAADYLRRSGYRILERNVRARFGEIDLVARQGQVLCFVEVKARSSTRFGWPEEAVTFRKRQKLIRLAQWYLRRHRAWQGLPVRFDILSILTGPDLLPARTRLIKNAFPADGC